MTRRWLMQLGGGVVLAGWSGVDLAAADLPPGVYEPSRDHLGHALAGNPIAVGGETELVQPRTAFKPAFFAGDEYQTLLLLTALILGETPETPVVREIAEWIDLSISDAGAVRSAALAVSKPYRTVAVHFYGAEPVRKLEELDAQGVAREGLAWLDAEARREHGRSFNSLQSPERLAIVASISDTRSNPAVNTGTQFFAYLKERVIDGFYTSRVGLEELGYRGNAFYASPPGCEHLHG